MTRKINFFGVFFILSFVFFILPKTVQADQIFCGMDLSIQPAGSYTVISDWWASGDGASPYDIYLDGNNEGLRFVGKLLSENGFGDSGTRSYTYSSPGVKTIHIKSGPGCDDYYSIEIPTPPSSTQGCTDSNATNYNPLATVDDGSCTYPYVNLNFVVSNSCGGAISGASVGINQNFGNGTSRTSDPSGFANFGVYSNTSIGWSISASGFGGSSGTVNSGSSGATVYPSLVPIGGCSIPNTAPNSPTISGVNSGYTNTSYAYTFAGTDPDNNQLKYGIDWSVPADGTVDEWVPSSGLVNSGTSQSTSHFWSTTGTKTIKALTQDSFGANSGWAGPFNITISAPPANVSGVCGTAAKVYSSATSAYSVPPDSYCLNGTLSITPAFPAQGGSASWSCLGSGTGIDASCVATRSASGYSLTVGKTGSGSVRSADGTIDCGSTCSQSYSQNFRVTLQAYPASSYWKFNGWTGDCSGTGLCTLIINGTKSVTANFVLRSFNYSEF